jgi:hypothetical protein
MTGLVATSLQNWMRKRGLHDCKMLNFRLALQEEKNAIEQKLISVPKLQRRLKELLELKKDEEMNRSSGMRRSLSGSFKNLKGASGDLKSIRSSRW